MRGRRKRGDAVRSEYTYDDRYLDAYMDVWRRQKEQELVNLRAEKRLLTSLIEKAHEPTTDRIQHSGA